MQNLHPRLRDCVAQQMRAGADHEQLVIGHVELARKVGTALPILPGLLGVARDESSLAAQPRKLRPHHAERAGGAADEGQRRCNPPRRVGIVGMLAPVIERALGIELRRGDNAELARRTQRFDHCRATGQQRSCIVPACVAHGHLASKADGFQAIDLICIRRIGINVSEVGRYQRTNIFNALLMMGQRRAQRVTPTLHLHRLPARTRFQHRRRQRLGMVVEAAVHYSDQLHIGATLLPSAVIAKLTIKLHRGRGRFLSFLPACATGRDYRDDNAGPSANRLVVLLLQRRASTL